VSDPKVSAVEGPAKVAELGTVISSDKKANWLAPKGGSMAARGVVLFMHGFSQGPNAYYENLQGLADQGFLVVAPEPPFAPTPGKQQGDMVDFAEHFRSKIYTNTLTGLPLKSKDVCHNIGLLSHSVGSGLATYVASKAASEKQPFKSVMYMAPQTQVEKEYQLDSAVAGWPADQKKSTRFALQYGLKDELAPPKLAVALKELLRGAGLPLEDSDITVYDQGTHVGFQDQVVLGDQEVAADVLPWLTPLLLALAGIGLPFIPWLSSLLLPPQKEKEAAQQPAAAGKMAAAPAGGSMLSLFEPESGPAGAASVGDFELLQQAARTSQARAASDWENLGSELMAKWKKAPDGIGPPEEVKIVSDEDSARQYIGLLLGVLALGGALTLPGCIATIKEGHIHWFSVLGAVLFSYLGYKGTTQLNLLKYVDTKQRPESREKAKLFMEKTL